MAICPLMYKDFEHSLLYEYWMFTMTNIKIFFKNWLHAALSLLSRIHFSFLHQVFENCIPFAFLQTKSLLEGLLRRHVWKLREMQSGPLCATNESFGAWLCSLSFFRALSRHRFLDKGLATSVSQWHHPQEEKECCCGFFFFSVIRFVD